MIYEKIIIVDTSLGSPKTFENIEAFTFKELQDAIFKIDKNVTFENKGAVIRGSNLSLELPDARLPQQESLTLFVTSRKIKGGLTTKELKEIAKENAVPGYTRMSKDALETKLNSLKLLPVKGEDKKEERVKSDNDSAFIQELNNLEDELSEALPLLRNSNEIRNIITNLYTFSAYATKEDNSFLNKELNKVQGDLKHSGY